MAEDNKTTSTKKVSAKKVENEEVKVEKKFCTKCGKELSNGETCTCEIKQQSVNINTDQLLNIGKNFLNTIVNIFKKPSTTLKEEINKSNTKSAIITLVIIAITYGLYMMGAFVPLINSFGSSLDLSINSYTEIPYFKIFMYMTIFNFILAFIPILVSLAIARITGNRNFSFAKSATLYESSLLPTVFTNILMAILYGLNLLAPIGALIGGFVNIVCFINYILVFLDITNIKEDRKAYAITSLIIVWIVAVFLFISVFLGSMYIDKSTPYSNNDIYDFNW